MNRFIEEVALSGISGSPLTLTPERGSEIVKSFLLWLVEKTGLRSSELVIAVGEDPRLSSRLLKVACFEALVPFGVSCLDCNITSAPAIEALVKGNIDFEVYNIKCDGAIMITSSKGDPHINGFKFFDQDGLLKEEDYSHILNLSKSDKNFRKLGEQTGNDNYIIKYGKKTYRTTEINLTQIYSKFLCQHLKEILNNTSNYNLPLVGFKICVDASNGTGGFIATKVFAQLGANIIDSQNLEPDGNFFNHPPDPENISAKHSVSMKTLAKGCNLGLLFDSDLSSFSAFDKLGFEINKLDNNISFERWLMENIKSLL
jgi:phosphomannomutase